MKYFSYSSSVKNGPEISSNKTPSMQAKEEYQKKYEKLISTIKTESIEECRVLLGNWDDKTKRIVLTMADAQGYTAVHHAASRALHRILTVLLESVPKQDDLASTTATSPDMLSTIPCTPNALVNMADAQGLTPLHHAAQAGCLECGMVNHPARCLLATLHHVIFNPSHAPNHRTGPAPPPLEGNGARPHGPQPHALRLRGGAHPPAPFA